MITCLDSDELANTELVDETDEVDELDEYDELNEYDEVDEIEEVDELDDPSNPGGKASWLDGPSTPPLALGFVVITGWDCLGVPV